MRKFAVLMDGGFVVKRLYDKEAQTHAGATEVLSALGRIRKHELLANQELLRLYYYDAAPLKGRTTNPIDKKVELFAEHSSYARMTKMHTQLEQSQDVALRMGELVDRGWKVSPGAIKQLGKTGRALEASDVKPNIQQKGVDLRIGLDIARLSLRRLVDVIDVVTGDSDLVPAFKFARREGIRLYLDHLGGSIRPELQAHTDAVL